MPELDSISFYPGKKQLMPVAFNIAIAPMLLYLLRLWPWPPTTLHLVAFILSTVLAVRYYKSRRTKPRLVIDDYGIHCGTSYATDSIEGVKPYMRALKVSVRMDGKVKEKVINLWWASKEDLQAIFSAASARYPILE